MKKEFLSKWSNTKTGTLNVAKAMPAEKYAYKPLDEIHSFAENLIHLGEALRYIGSKAIDVTPQKYNGDPNDKELICSFIEEAFVEIETIISGLDASFLIEMKDFWAGERSALHILYFVCDHTTHHRSKASVYLRLNGIKPPDYIGW